MEPRSAGRLALAIAAILALGACTPRRPVPQIMVMPGPGKNVEDFDADDWSCREIAEQRIGISPDEAANESTATGAALGTLLGGAAGAAIGAAAGNPGLGAAAGAGFGLLSGTSIGAANGQMDAWSVQRSYDVAYAQCMQASGNRVPRRRVARYEPPPGYDDPGPPPGYYGPGPPPYAPPPPPPPPGYW